MKRVCIALLLIAATAFGASFEDDLIELSKAENFAQKETVIKELSGGYKNDERLSLAFSQMLSGNLYKTSQNSLVYQEGSYVIDILSGKKLEIGKDEIDKITINNRLRTILRSELAAVNLVSKDTKIRLNAAKELLLSVEEKDYALLYDLSAKESDKKIKDVLSEALSVLDAKYKSGEKQQEAINALGNSLSPIALQTLNELSSIETTPHKKEITDSIKKIENSKKFYSILETLYFGLSAGSILLLAAMGLAITFGVMKIINMAHGELIMLGAYTTYTIQQIMPNFIEYSVIIAIPIAFLVSALVGILIERLVLRHLYARPLEALLATFGISLILQQLVRTIYSPLNKEVKTPEWMSGSFEINSILSLTYNRFYIIIFTLLVFAFALFVLKKTSLGLKVRAVSQNRGMAQAMGVKTNLVDALTFGIGSGIAGVAGVALSQLTNVGPNLGQAYIVDSFMVVVFGGVGNLWGTLIGAFTLGEINKIIEPLSGAVLAKVIILAAVILFIQKHPRGLFPQKGRDAED
ncbi:MAG: urea ABC transporter permease subunit UrtB [Campylobacteraceae bacterium]|jgi:urea transport system permease protein|nr:urea ABC transporter permease subunit UrtB [Campylobacteraceae bacterium]